MRTRWKVILILIALLLLAFSVSLAWSTPQKESTPMFTPEEREAVQAFYLRLMGTLAPGSISRTPLWPNIERALKVGSPVPMQLEKDLAPLLPD
jgi:hypothetical protein